MHVPELLRGTSVIASVFFSSLATSLSFSAIPALMMQKICCPDKKPPDVDYICRDSDLVAFATGIATTRNALRTALSALGIIFFSYNRDKTGRSKRLMVVGEVAELTCSLSYLWVALEWRISPWLVTINESIIGGLLGESILQLGANCLVIENSSPKDRTMKIQLYMTTLFMGSMVASALYGYLLTAVGYLWYFLLVVCLHGISITLTGVFVKNKMTKVQREESPFEHLKNLFKTTPNVAIIWMMMTSKALVNTYISGEESVLIYYLQQGFQFTIKEEGLFDTYRSLVHVVGSFTFPLLFTKMLKWTDIKIGIVSSFYAAVIGTITAFVRTKSQLYLWTLMDLLKYVLCSIPEAVISKNVNDADLGKFLGTASIMESIVTVFAAETYRTVFTATDVTMPGAFFFISASLNIIVLVIFSISFWIHCPTEITKNVNSEERENGPIDSEP